MEPAAAASQYHQMVASPRLAVPDPRSGRDRAGIQSRSTALEETELRPSPETPNSRTELGSSPAPTPPLLFAVKRLKTSFILTFFPVFQ